MWRQFYRSVSNPESFLGDVSIRRLMGLAAPGEAGAGGLADLRVQIELWRDEQTRVYRELAGQAAELGNQREFAEALLAHSAPLASVLGCWLQGMSAPGVFEDSAQLKLMELLAHDVGVGRPLASRADHFKSLLVQVGLTAYAVSPFELATLPDLPDELFELPALLQAVSRRSDAFGDTLCGIDYAWRALGLGPWWAALDAQQLDTRRLDLNQLDGAASALDISQWVCEQVAGQGSLRRLQLEAGAQWLFAALKTFNERLLAHCRAAVSPERLMGKMIQRMARAGAVYHQDYKMEGRSLAQWLREAQIDPVPLLEMLSRSRLIVPGNADKSLLVNTLVAPNGRMFRIFSEADLSVIRKWIDGLSGPIPLAEAAAVPAPVQVDGPVARASGQDTQEQGQWPKSLRDAYFVLQGRALGPRTQAFAQAYVARWLEQSRRSLRDSERTLPEAWNVGVLREWLLDKHDRHGQEFEDSDPAAMPSREEIVDSTLQLAPLTLIDGAWLQGFTDLSLASSHVGYALFQTYWDELGNGSYALNHPKIYRDGLRQMGLELAPTGAREFAEDARLREESFRLPVYWLCLGKLPVTFMPEILGMNLAMELSGVGGSYRSARRFLRHYGFSTAFVDLHNTIDNVSTGHSAWAVDAIDAYMRQVAATQPGQQAEHWQRVRVGYESLAPQPDRLTSWLRRLGIGSADAVLPRSKALGEDQALLHHEPIVPTTPAGVTA
ncbi:iron-containing redox enzyme family protein [Pseudomonas chlororaphis]|uniref:Inducer of phenazine B n=1 Tax=Pseudomonas chlororaphis TaxID=587753 RepID=A0A1Q8ET15_9PSED|nr:iron-containing redox enzyme family protein [Pseudomonas chlororaphis]OLF54935.1 inducer of phenazine B [Pseudomonas chlororaphis]